jgi:hypothetical protein
MMIKRVYPPLNVEGIEFTRYDRIVIVDKFALVNSLLAKEEIDEYLFNQLTQKAEDLDAMLDVMEEVVKMREETKKASSESGS